MANYKLYTAKDQEGLDCFLVSRDGLLFSCRKEDMIYDVTKLEQFYVNLYYSDEATVNDFTNVQQISNWVDDQPGDVE